MDIDIYDQDGVKVDVSGMKIDIQFVIGRIKYKNPLAVSIPDNARAVVNVAERLGHLERKSKMPFIYHYLNISIEFASLNVQVKLYDADNATESRMVLLIRHNHLPTLDQCDFLKVVRKINDTDGKLLISDFEYT